MIWIIMWIFQSIFWALGMVISKLALENKLIGNNLQTLFSRTAHFSIIWVIFVFWFLDNNFSEVHLNYLEWWLFILSAIALYFTYFLRRAAYANEKVSVLQPFAMLFQIFPVIIWFIFIATERANFITFLMAILASIIVIVPSIDFKQFKINKYSLMVLLSSTIKSTQLFFILHLLTKFNPQTMYFVESIIIICLSLIMMISKKEFWQFKLLTKRYSWLLFTANSIWIVSIILALTMYTQLWVVATSLISLLYLVFVYLFWYIILKETPSRKDIIIAVLVAGCIFIWMIFKN